MVKPNPCAYCSVEHANTLFPELLIQLRHIDDPDPYALLAVIKRSCCASVANTGLTCDPARCQQTFRHDLGRALATDHPVASLGWTAKQCYRSYYEQEVLLMDQKRVQGAIAEIDLTDIFSPGQSDSY